MATSNARSARRSSSQRCRPPAAGWPRRLSTWCDRGRSEAAARSRTAMCPPRPRRYSPSTTCRRARPPIQGAECGMWRGAEGSRPWRRSGEAACCPPGRTGSIRTPRAPAASLATRRGRSASQPRPARERRGRRGRCRSRSRRTPAAVSADDPRNGPSRTRRATVRP